MAVTRAKETGQGMRVAKLPITAPWSANVTEMQTRARRSDC
ncbi:hypothetical protein ACQP1K_14295 [Sphaerimonospora sp. CA-214678]